MGTRKDRERQEMLWMAASEIRATAAHPFYVRLNELLDSKSLRVFIEWAYNYTARNRGARLITGCEK